jgi:O-antigen/teichoic acid export membrane protein
MPQIRTEHSLRKKLTHGFSAAGLGPIVTAFVQLVTVPVLLRAWGAQRYGEWLLLSAVPSYLSMTDMGFGSAAGNQMTMDVASGDRQSALQTFQTTGALIAAATLIALAATLIAAGVLPAGDLLHISTLTQPEIRTILLYLSTYSLLSLYNTLLAAGYRCDGNFARGTVVQNGIRFIENLAGIVVAFQGGGLVNVALTLAGARLAGTVFMACDLIRLSPWLRIGIKHARTQRIRSLFVPALGFMAFPAGYALSLQGTLVLVGVMLGPVAAATFSTLRTLTRFGYQLGDVVRSSFWPEISVAFGKGDLALARRLHRVSCQLSLWLALLSAGVLWLTGEKLFHLWTHGRVAFEKPVLILMLCSVVANSLWNTSSVVSLASNSHSRVAALFLVATSASVIAAYFLTPHLKLVGTSLSLLVIDVIMCAYTMGMSFAALREDPALFLGSLFDTSIVSKLIGKTANIMRKTEIAVTEQAG